ncbi:MAG: hypothetical protein ABL308_07715 [Oceanicaulis sp.]
MAGPTGSGVAVGLASADQQGNQGGGLSVFNIFPLMLIPVLIYVVVGLITGMGDVTGFVGTIQDFQSGLCQGMANAGPDAGACRVGALHGTLFSLGLPSGVWTISTGDLILMIGLVVLFIEMIKSAGSGTATLLNHGLSMATFLISILLFLLVPMFATSVFFLITLMALMDVVAGFSITAIAARRDLGT